MLSGIEYVVAMGAAGLAAGSPELLFLDFKQRITVGAAGLQGLVLYLPGDWLRDAMRT